MTHRTKLRQAAFMIESFAHLQGREDLLPLADHLRAIANAYRLYDDSVGDEARSAELSYLFSLIQE